MPFISLIYVICNVEGLKLDCDKRMTLGKSNLINCGYSESGGKTKIMRKFKKIRGVKKKQPCSHVLLSDRPIVCLYLKNQ